MDLSRRQMSLLLPFVAAAAVAQQQQPESLSSTIYYPDQSTDLPGKSKKSSRIFFGKDHSGFQLEMHETVLGPGVEAHPPHKHVHEEIIIVLEGTLESHVEDKTERGAPGAVIYFGSNQLHNSRNPGQVPVRYYVLELRGHEA
jgi:quercetin dioxygenase-like cupin family protein